MARSAGAVRQAVADASADLPAPWPRLVAEAGTPAADELNDRIDTAIAEAARARQGDHPGWWRAVGLVQWALALATMAGLVWLALLAVAAYLRIPEPPTPTYRDIPVPTGLLLGGIVLGLLVAFVAARLAAVGAARRARAVRRRAERAVGSVTDDLVIQPIERELANRSELRELLLTARGDR